MPLDQTEIAILLADISGSTPLYESIGDTAAARQIADCIAQMRSIAEQHNGSFIRSKGDDVLCAFEDPSLAFRAARRMLSVRMVDTHAVHAGLHYGHVVYVGGDIFGDAVNLTARLASMAKAGEVLVSGGLVERLLETDCSCLRSLDTITMKGKSASTRVYSFLRDAGMPNTEVDFVFDHEQQHLAEPRANRHAQVLLVYGDQTLSCKEGMQVFIGRSPECDLIVDRPWVSRTHAAITIRDGKVHLEDQSTSGTYVSLGEDREFFMRRENVVLTGRGTISPVVRSTDDKAELIHFEADANRLAMD